MRGALNVSDLSRIQNNIQILIDVLEINTTVAEIPEFINTSFLDNIIKNVELIRKAYMIYTHTPKTPSHPLNTFSKWNDLEKILDDVYTILNSNFHYHCGDIYAGESIGLLL
jgi:hypothetical protein